MKPEIENKIFAVIDTNVLVSALIATKVESYPLMVVAYVFTDAKDIVFYEVKLSKRDSYLVTGNKKHFPQKPFVITPKEMVEICIALKTR